MSDTTTVSGIGSPVQNPQATPDPDKAQDATRQPDADEDFGQDFRFSMDASFSQGPVGKRDNELKLFGEIGSLNAKWIFLQRGEEKNRDVRRLGLNVGAAWLLDSVPDVANDDDWDSLRTESSAALFAGPSIEYLLISGGDDGGWVTLDLAYGRSFSGVSFLQAGGGVMLTMGKKRGTFVSGGLNLLLPFGRGYATAAMLPKMGFGVFF